MISVPGSSCLPVDAALCRGRAKGQLQFLPPQSTALFGAAVQLWLPHCWPTPHFIPWALHLMGAPAAALLPSAEIILFWSEGVTVAGSKSGPFLGGRNGRKVSLLCLLAQGTARHGSEMWQEAVAGECCLPVGRARSKPLYPFFPSWGALPRPAGIGYQYLGLPSWHRKESSCSKHWGQCPVPLNRYSPLRHTCSLQLSQWKLYACVQKRSFNPHTDPHQWFQQKMLLAG